MEKLNFKYKRELGTNIFSYSMIMKGESIYRMVNTDGNNPTIKEDRTSNKIIKLILKVPKKKVVWSTDTWTYMGYDMAIKIYKEKYLKKYTKIVDDKDKFEETHQKGYNILYNKFKEII